MPRLLAFTCPLIRISSLEESLTDSGRDSGGGTSVIPKFINEGLKQIFNLKHVQNMVKVPMLATPPRRKLIPIPESWKRIPKRSRIKYLPRLVSIKYIVRMLPRHVSKGHPQGYNLGGTKLEWLDLIV
jgi:hypothetical protein